MPTQTITVVRRRQVRDDIEADVLGCFAIHECLTSWMDPKGPLWTVTHIPTGWACLHTRTRRAALAARRAFVGSGLPWNFTDPSEMSAECRALGREIKSSFEGK